MKSQKTVSLFVLLLVIGTLNAQIPTEVPKPSDKPIDITNPADIIIYIVLPLCVVLLFFIWRGRKKNQNK